MDLERKLEMPEGARCLTMNEEGVLGEAGGVGRGLVGAGTGVGCGWQCWRGWRGCVLTVYTNKARARLFMLSLRVRKMAESVRKFYEITMFCTLQKTPTVSHPTGKGRRRTCNHQEKEQKLELPQLQTERHCTRSNGFDSTWTRPEAALLAAVPGPGLELEDETTLAPNME